MRKGQGQVRTEATERFDICSNDGDEELQQKIVEVAGVFAPISEVEEKLGEKAQEAIVNIPIGKAAEILTLIVSPTNVKNPDRHVTTAANRYGKERATDEEAANAAEVIEEPGAANAAEGIGIGIQNHQDLSRSIIKSCLICYAQNVEIQTWHYTR